MPVQAWRGKHQGEGEIVFFAQGRYAIVLVHPPLQLEAFLKAIVSRMID
jgi:hypothetical protein